MTPDERDRLVRVEVLAEQNAKDVATLRVQMSEINGKLDAILTTLSLSKGAYRALIIVGSVGAAVTTMLGGAFAWLMGVVK